MLSWPWRPWRKTTIVVDPPREAERGDRVVIRNLEAVRVAVAPPGKAYVCPSKVSVMNTVVEWTPSGRGATCRLRRAGYEKPAPAGPTDVQIVLNPEENRWLDE